jgi:serine/threonine-protein kinase
MPGRRRRQVTEETAPQPAARYVEEEVTTPPPRRPLIWPWLVLLLLLVAGAIAAAILLTRDDESTPRVPNVVGISTEAAVQRLGQRGYATDVRTRVSNGTRVGTVLSQAPAGGTKLDRGSRVTVVTARRPVSTGVPDVVGVPVADAFVRLQATGFKGKTTKVASNRPKDTVLRQAPAAGTRAEKGTTVLLTISKGGQTVALPRVVGLTEAVATAKLDRVGFRASVSRVPSTKPEGLVVSQEPAQGANAPKGSIVGIKVSDGPSVTTETGTTTTPVPGGPAVPMVVGMGQAAAMARLERTGFRADSYPVASRRPRGLVVSQRPAGGTRAPPQTVARLGVALGPGVRPFRVVPDVAGLKEADAKRVLVRVGFTVRALEPANGTSEGAVVTDQRPSADARARAGSQVLIYLGPAQ